MHVIIQEIYFIESIDGRVENKLGTGALQSSFTFSRQSVVLESLLQMS